ncbi:hypothetical protein IWX47DRAFT_169325 [Phyllosticta citricarpa]|uniref:Uncharacterized protein n=1 Tax=Phyllosticta citricarpa TaxID=55181 RepID=A0ABR1MKG0_9PEZI
MGDALAATEALVLYTSVLPRWTGCLGDWELSSPCSIRYFFETRAGVKSIMCRKCKKPCRIDLQFLEEANFCGQAQLARPSKPLARQGIARRRDTKTPPLLQSFFSLGSKVFLRRNGRRCGPRLQKSAQVDDQCTVLRNTGATGTTLTKGIFRAILMDAGRAARFCPR